MNVNPGYPPDPGTTAPIQESTPRLLTHFSVAAEVLPHHGRFSVNHGRKNRLIPTCPGIDQMLKLVTS